MRPSAFACDRHLITFYYFIEHNNCFILRVREDICSIVSLSALCSRSHSVFVLPCFLGAGWCSGCSLALACLCLGCAAGADSDACLDRAKQKHHLSPGQETKSRVSPIRHCDPAHKAFRLSSANLLLISRLLVLCSSACPRFSIASVPLLRPPGCNQLQTTQF